MARAADAALGARLRTFMVAGPHAPGPLRSDAQWFDAAHPVPNDTSVAAGARALEIASIAGASPDGVLLVLLSGGASSLLCAPADGVPLEDKVRAAALLMRAGVDIVQLNVVRKHLSRIKGGQLGAAATRCVTLALSDVHDPPDDPATIGSGPTVADPSTFADALGVLARLNPGDTVPATVRTHLEGGAQHRVAETVKPEDPRLAHSSFHVLANRHTASIGAVDEARRLGYAVHVLDAAITGEARVAGRLFAERALAVPPLGPRLCVIASGETTVTVRGDGRGGRNQEFALGAADVLAGRDAVVLGSAGTDGIDGPTDAAGALVSSTTAARAAGLGIDIGDVLDRNDAYPAFDRLGDLLRWGPTFTNVGDVHVLLTMYQ